MSDVKFAVHSMDTDVTEETADNEHRMGNEYSRRCTWLTGDPESPYLSLTSTTYANGQVMNNKGETVREAQNYGDQQDEELPVWDGSVVEDYPEDQLFLQLYEYCQDEWLWHTDPEDLGGTEVNSNVEMDLIGYTFHSSVEESNKFCREWLEGKDYFKNYSPENA